MAKPFEMTEDFRLPQRHLATRLQTGIMLAAPMKTAHDPLTLESLANKLSDSDSEWWPFVFLRPAQHQRFDSVRCLTLAVLQGLPATTLALFIGTLAGEHLNGPRLVMFPLCVCAMLFLLFRLTFAFFWNKRADRLRPLYERRADWQRAATASDRSD